MSQSPAMGPVPQAVLNCPHGFLAPHGKKRIR
jgi:hypothetical protein